MFSAADKPEFVRPKAVNALRVLADGRLASVGDDGRLIMWDLGSGKHVATKFPGPAVCLDVGPRGSLAVGYVQARKAFVAFGPVGAKFNASRVLSIRGWSSAVRPMTLAADESAVFVPSRGSGIDVVDVTSGTVRATLSVPRSGGEVLALVRGAGEELVSGTATGQLQLWDSRRRKIIFKKSLLAPYYDGDSDILAYRWLCVAAD